MLRKISDSNHGCKAIITHIRPRDLSGGSVPEGIFCGEEMGKGTAGNGVETDGKRPPAGPSPGVRSDDP